MNPETHARVSAELAKPEHAWPADTSDRSDMPPGRPFSVEPDEAYDSVPDEGAPTHEVIAIVQAPTRKFTSDEDRARGLTEHERLAAVERECARLRHAVRLLANGLNNGVIAMLDATEARR